jgi:predicted secreted protein
MRRTLLPIAVIAICTYSFGQSAQPAQAAQPAHAASSDSQTLQALLSEVRALRQDLRASLNRAQSMQVLLARFQIQQGVTTRATDRFNDARQKLLDTQIHQKELALEQKRIEESAPATDAQEQSDTLDRLHRVKSELEVVGRAVQQRQTSETEAEQQLREEQDKLNALESQLDEFVATMGESNSKPAGNRP